jgi:glutathione S-transferase
MSKPKLTYFDAPVSRGEECRLAFHVAGVDFEDHRIKREEWAAMKPSTPFGSLPTLEIPGHPTLGQSNAILVLIGRLHGLHPKDLYEAARHEALMGHVEDLRAAIVPSMRMEDAAARQKAREQLAATTIPTWAAFVERQLGDGPFVAGNTINVVDIKLSVVTRWISNGTLDHIPQTVIDAFPKLVRLRDAVRDHAGVKSWYAR